jgi:hypothetical protein
MGLKRPSRRPCLLLCRHGRLLHLKNKVSVSAVHIAADIEQVLGAFDRAIANTVMRPISVA